jgi:hypothetical protein
MSVFLIAESLAADLAGARVDPNEAQKALAYLRSKRNGKMFFTYLRAINQNGRAVIRSNQTLNYYRDLLTICERHLTPLQGNYEEMVQTFGWSLRLLRYYRAVPEAAEERAAQQRITNTSGSQPIVTSKPSVQQDSVQPSVAGPQIPDIGAVFTGKVIERDDTVIIVQVPGFSETKVMGVLKVEPGVPAYRAGRDSARVEVTGVRQAKSGKTIVELKPGPKKQP